VVISSLIRGYVSGSIVSQYVLNFRRESLVCDVVIPAEIFFY
jgi:hypothetical protein